MPKFGEVGVALHYTTHEDEGTDEISVASLSGELADDQKSTWAKVSSKPTTFPPDDHSAMHEDGGDGEISVAALSGELADDQPPKSHGADKHANVTRFRFIPAGGYSDGVLSNVGWWSCWNFGDGVTRRAHFVFHVPSDFISFVSVKGIWTSEAASGNMSWEMWAYYRAAGEELHVNVDYPAKGITATGGVYILDVQEPANPLTLSNLAVGNYVSVRFRRFGGDAVDTIGGTVNCLGILFTYIASQ